MSIPVIIKFMRPLNHPSINDVTVEGILYALSDPVRMQIYVGIAAADCPQSCSTFICMKDKTLPKSTLSQHFKVLREAGLIRSVRKGVEMQNTTRCAELKERFGPLMSGIFEAYKIQHSTKKKKS
jgi:DNA-binding transcriptional ArsR family regulator